jgi:hypothetical protein
VFRSLRKPKETPPRSFGLLSPFGSSAAVAPIYALKAPRENRWCPTRPRCDHRPSQNADRRPWEARWCDLRARAARWADHPRRLGREEAGTRSLTKTVPVYLCLTLFVLASLPYLFSPQLPRRSLLRQTRLRLRRGLGHLAKVYKPPRASNTAPETTWHVDHGALGVALGTIVQPRSDPRGGEVRMKNPLYDLAAHVRRAQTTH